MASEDGADEGGVGTTVGVATALEELRSRGAAMLVVGSVPESVYARLSAEMLGTGPDRRRLVVDPGRGLDARLDGVDRWTPEWTRVLRCHVTPDRSAAAGGADGGVDAPGTSPNDGSPGAGDDTRSVTTTVEGSITNLGVAVGSTIGWFDAVAGGLDPAELRVAFDCGVRLLSAYPDATVFRFFHLLTNQIRLADGMGHVRLSRPFDAESTRLLAPLFDVTVELRLVGSEPQHRWHFRDADVSSEWLPIDASV